ncbi:hypothetical protein [Nocardia sp. XZ_19_231]|uniref:hypothetical protein n=1 Tax=Nocardia sp. XZ_19_231 TaxID=2769252 RepID=UPI00188E7388|nr:hypothetical protein [Nocardia sp. XZ_19_231]
MTFEISAAHRELFDHLLDDEGGRVDCCIVPAALAGHFPHTDYRADLPIEVPGVFLAIPNPADPARLLVGVIAPQIGDRGLLFVGLDYIAHLDCEHPICQGVHSQRRDELAQIPADSSVFAVCDVHTPALGDGPRFYLTHINDHHDADSAGWNGVVAEYTELACWWNPDHTGYPVVGGHRHGSAHPQTGDRTGKL